MLISLVWASGMGSAQVSGVGFAYDFGFGDWFGSLALVLDQVFISLLRFGLLFWDYVVECTS